MINNPIIVIGFEDTGIESGELDYCIDCSKVADLTNSDFQRMLKLLQDDIPKSCTIKDEINKRGII